MMKFLEKRGRGKAVSDLVPVGRGLPDRKARHVEVKERERAQRLAARDQFASKLSKVVAQRISQGYRGYTGAEANRLTEGWLSPATSGNEELYSYGQRLRNRAREQERNNGWITSFLRKSGNAIVGSQGVKLKSQAMTRRGLPDLAAQTAVLESWTEWAKSVTPNKLTLVQLLKQSVVSRRRDGELFWKVIEGPAARNAFRFCLQPLEADVIDWDKNESKPYRGIEGREVRMGIELQDGEPVKYYALKTHPGDSQWGTGNGYRDYEEIPARDMVHYFEPARVNDARGITQLHSALLPGFLMSGYEEAEIVIARAQACIGAWFQKEYPEGFDPEYGDNLLSTDVNDDGEINAEGEDRDGDSGTIDMILEYGQSIELPPHVKPILNKPTHPNENYPAFINSQLHKLSAAVGMSHHTLTGNLSEVNFSSARMGHLDDQEEWKCEQGLLIHKLDEIYPRWLAMALMMGRVKGYDMRDYDRLLPHKFVPRSWAYIQPLEEAKAQKEQLANLTTSPQRIIRERGEDPEIVQQELVEWNEWKQANRIGEAFDKQVEGNETQTQSEPDDDSAQD